MRTITPFILVMVLCLPACAGILPTGPALHEFQRLEKLRPLVIRRVEQLETQTRAQVPELAQYHADLERWRKLGETAPNARRFAQWFSAQPDKSIAQDTYNRLRGQYMQLEMADALADPRREPALKKAMLARDQFVAKLHEQLGGLGIPDADLDNNDKLWKAYRQVAARDAQTRRQQIADLERASGWPDFALQHARLISQVRFNVESLYFPAIELTTPPDLRAAREQLKLVEQGIASANPDWHQLEKQKIAQANAAGQRKVAAEVLGRTVYLDEVAPSSAAVQEYIVAPLLDRYAEQHAIRASDSDAAAALREIATQVQQDIAGLRNANANPGLLSQLTRRSGELKPGSTQGLAPVWSEWAHNHVRRQAARKLIDSKGGFKQWWEAELQAGRIRILDDSVRSMIDGQ